MFRSSAISSARPSLRTALLRTTLAVGIILTNSSAQATEQSASDPASSNVQSGASDNGGAGPIKLRSPRSAVSNDFAEPTPNVYATRPNPATSEFERYVQQLSERDAATPGQVIHRFGAELITDLQVSSGRSEPLASVPGDYVIKSGDEIQLTLWGSVDADLRLAVDRTGRITVPRVGAIPVAGLRNTELNAVISRQVSTVFRNFQLSTSLSQVRPVRVFVTGYALRPGSLTVSGLSSVLHVLMRSGGPSAAGSFRNISLRRAGREVLRFDLYDLLLKGDRRADQLVQPDDVVHIGPVGAQVGVIGSVNQPAVFELGSNDRLTDVLQMAGGFNAVADRSRVTLERLSNRLNGKVVEWQLPQSDAQSLEAGDVVRVFSAINTELPKEKQKKRVRIEGEVTRPGEYVLAPNSTIDDALRAAGGVTSAAYLYGTDFSRETVRRMQQENYDRALRDLETDMVKSQTGRRTSTADEAVNQANVVAANARLLERLRQIRPTGRVVLQLEPEASQLPSLPLEDGDRITIPARPTSIGVFGSVFNPGSFVFEPGHVTADYLQLAGGPTRGADKESMFLVRANGSVVSAQQGTTFWGTHNAFSAARTVPGDTLFVPENLDKTTFTQNLKDLSQIFYQFGLGIAGIKAIGL